MTKLFGWSDDDPEARFNLKWILIFFVIFGLPIFYFAFAL